MESTEQCRPDGRAPMDEDHARALAEGLHGGQRDGGGAPF